MVQPCPCRVAVMAKSRRPRIWKALTTILAEKILGKQLANLFASIKISSLPPFSVANKISLPWLPRFQRIPLYLATAIMSEA